MNERLEKVEPPGRRAAIALAVAVHVLLAAFLIYGVQWQSERTEVVEVDLVRAVPAPTPAAEPAPPEPKPPVVAPKPEPRPEPKPVPVPKAPDIAVKEKEKPKPPPPKEEPKPVFNPFDEAMKRESEQLAQRKTAAAVDAELAQVKAASARSKAVADYVAKIKGKIRGNIVMPPEMKSNPEAVFEVTQLPSGEILSVKLKKASGNPAWDSATERAILKSSPLPKPDAGDVFSRNLELKFRPLDD